MKGVDWEEEVEGECFDSDNERILRSSNRGGKRGIGSSALSDVEVLASEILTNRKLLAVFLELGERPKQAKELVNARICSIAMEKDKYDRTIPKIVRERLPQSTMYRLLKRLADTGLVEVYRGFDRRKKYYKLNDLGRKVLEKVLEVIKESIKDYLRTPSELKILDKTSRAKLEGFRGLREKDFELLIAKNIGVDPELLEKMLNVKKMRLRYGSERYPEESTFVFIHYPERTEAGEKVRESYLSMW